VEICDNAIIKYPTTTQTQLRGGGIFSNHFTADFPQNVILKEF